MLRRLSLSDLRQIFGANAGEEIWSIDDDQWSGPIYSSHGTHLVRVVARSEERLQNFESVANLVANDWKTDRQARILSRKVDELQDKYDVVIDPEIEEFLE